MARLFYNIKAEDLPQKKFTFLLKKKKSKKKTIDVRKDQNHFLIHTTLTTEDSHLFCSAGLDYQVLETEK